MASLPDRPKPTAARAVRFGPFELNLDGGELRRQGRLVTLQDQQIVVLKYLVEHAGRTVTREDLRSEIWGQETYVEFETGLYNTITRLRRSLGDAASNPHFIETIPKEGYRFIAAVERIEANEGEVISTSWLAAPLETPTESSSQAVSNQGGQRFPLWALLSATAVLAGALGGMIGLLFSVNDRGSAEPDRVYRYSIPIAGVEEIKSLAISPSGDQIVFQGANNLLWRRYLDRVDLRPIRGSEGGVSPFFSPDGQRLGFFSNNVLRIAEGEHVRRLAVLPSGFHFADAVWAPDGFIYFNTRIGTAEGIWRIPEQGGRCELVVPALYPGSGPVYPLVNQVTARPRHLLIYSTDSGPIRRSIHARDLDTKVDKTIVGRGIGGYLWPEGRLTFFKTGSLFAGGFDSKNLRLQGTPVEMLKDVDIYHWQSGRASISNNGTLVYAAKGNPELKVLEWIDTDGRVTRLPFPPDQYQQVVVSPAGDLLSIVRGEGGNKASLWTYGISTGAWHRILDSDVPNLRAQWSPDQTALVVSLAHQNEDFVNLYRVALSNPAHLQRLTQEPDYGQFPLSWSAKANAILFIEGVHERSLGDVMVLPLSGNLKPKPLVATPGSDRSASFSPDGQWFVYESDSHGKPEIFLQQFDRTKAEVSGTVLRLSDAGGRDPVWAPDGRSIYYSDLSQRLIEVALSADKVPRARRRLDVTLPEYRDYWTNRLSISPDGRLLVARPLARPPQVAEIQVVVNWGAEVKSLSPAP